MKRLLIIPAAGRGSRLAFDGPKALCPVNGRPMLDYLFERYGQMVNHVVVVAAPDAATAVERRARLGAVPATCVVQERPTGMLPAILCAVPAVEQYAPDEVWITWCDQIGISGTTVSQLDLELQQHASAALIFPTVRQEPPYIHFARDAQNRIVAVHQRREGDAMPEVGESDTGLFAMRRETYLDRLLAYDEAAPFGDGTRERNFLPFIPWLSQSAEVRTFPLADPREAVGVNTPEDVKALEIYLGERA